MILTIILRWSEITQNRNINVRNIFRISQSITISLYSRQVGDISEEIATLIGGQRARDHKLSCASKHNKEQFLKYLQQGKLLNLFINASVHPPPPPPTPPLL